MSGNRARAERGIGLVTLAVVAAVVALGWVAGPWAMLPATAVAVLAGGVVAAAWLAPRRAGESESGREDAPEFAADDRASVEPTTAGPVEATDWSFREDDSGTVGDGSVSGRDAATVDDADGSGEESAEASFEFGPELEAT